LNNKEMPIVYACLINRNNTVVFEAMARAQPNSMKRYVENAGPKFEMYGQSSMQLSDELALDYCN
jgi:hypothetical protein